MKPLLCNAPKKRKRKEKREKSEQKTTQRPCSLALSCPPSLHAPSHTLCKRTAACRQTKTTSSCPLAHTSAWIRCVHACLVCLRVCVCVCFCVCLCCVFAFVCLCAVCLSADRDGRGLALPFLSFAFLAVFPSPSQSLFCQSLSCLFMFGLIPVLFSVVAHLFVAITTRQHTCTHAHTHMYSHAHVLTLQVEGENVWQNGDGNEFRVRVGPNYSKNGKKAPSLGQM